jgi:hypothetical protein
LRLIDLTQSRSDFTVTQERRSYSLVETALAKQWAEVVRQYGGLKVSIPIERFLSPPINLESLQPTSSKVWSKLFSQKSGGGFLQVYSRTGRGKIATLVENVS